MKRNELLYEAGYAFGFERDGEVTGVACDTRAIKPGNLFVALKGRKLDGHKMISEAARCGATSAVTEYEIPDAELPYVCVPDTREALARLSDAFYGHPSKCMKLIGVTGTNGKTTVTEILRSILTESGMRVGVIGTLGATSGERILDTECADETAHMTTPDPPVFYRLLSEMRDDGCDAVIAEATSHASALRKLTPLTFDLMLFTSLTHDHLDFHGSMKAYGDAKAALFRQTKRALICLDGSESEAFPKRLGDTASAYGAEVRTCSARPETETDFLVEETESSFEAGTAFRLLSRKGEYAFRSDYFGVCSAMNLAESAAAAQMLGVPNECIRTALARFCGVRGRMERIALPEAGFSVYIDFAHTPDAMEHLLKTVRRVKRPEARAVVLFGCGGDRDPLKRKEMAIAVSRYADFAYITSDNSRSEDPNAIIQDILKGMNKEKPFCVIPSRKAAIETAICEARAGDILLLCGKGHETYEIDREGVHPFCEADAVRAAFRKRMKEYGGKRV